MSVIPFDPQIFGNASNNGRMLGEMDAQHAIVQTIGEIAHVLTGRTETEDEEEGGPGQPVRQVQAEEEEVTDGWRW